MRKGKRLIGAILAAIISISLLTPAYAVDVGFEDTQDSRYNLEIGALKENGLVAGGTDDNYHPSDTMTIGHFLIVCYRWLVGDGEARLMASDVPFELVQENIAYYMWTIGHDNYAYSLDKPLKLNEAARILFDLAGLPLYDEALYEGQYQPKEYRSEHDGYDALVRLGLIDTEQFQPDSELNREQAAYLIYNILYGELTVETPTYFEQNRIIIGDTTVNTDSLLKYYIEIPEVIRNDFNTREWKIVTGKRSNRAI